jgi:hypothetical protein
MFATPFGAVEWSGPISKSVSAGVDSTQQGPVPTAAAQDLLLPATIRGQYGTQLFEIVLKSRFFWNPN